MRACVALCVLLAACHEDPTEIILVVDTDLMVPSELDNIHVTVTGTMGAHAFDMDPHVGSAGDPSLPLSVALEHQSGAPLSPVTVAVVGQHGGAAVVRRDVRTGFVAGEARLLRIVLARSCIDATMGGPRDCGVDMTCSESGCVAQTIAGTALPPFSTLPSRYDGGTFGDGCRAEACNGMDDNCNGVADEGFDLQNETANCGTCGNDCRTKTGVATAHCAMGACVVDTCTASRGDCSGGGADGCETDTSTSAMFCGDCSHACSTVHATPTCAGGACSLACTTGFADCDTMVDTGCEADLTDVGNCGRCFHHCTASCSGGYCDDDVVVQLVSGGSHTCALRRSGHVVCWGANGSGRLGDGSTTTRASPVDVLGLTDAVAIAAGDQHTCAVRMDGHVVCWGAGSHGQLGNGATLDSPTPVVVSGFADARLITAGLAHTCVVRTSGAVKCWGSNNTGQIGNGSTTDALTPADVAVSDATAIVAGQSHTCALRMGGGVSCWGSGGHGQLASGPILTMSSSPVAIPGLTGVTAIAGASGANHVCVIGAAGAVQCWGQGAEGEIGDGTSSDHGAPTSVTLPMAAMAIGIGATHSCAALADGSVSCWGANDHGQLGDGLTLGHATPMPVLWPAGAPMTVAVAGGNAHTCARDTSGALTCWGWNLTGQLGDGTMVDHPRPNPVHGLPF